MNALATPAPLASARAWTRRVVRDAVVGVERVARSVGEDQLRLELPDQVRQPLDGGRIHDERVVTEVEAPEVRAECRCGGLRLAVTDLLHSLLRLPLLLPQLARLAPLAVGERDHVRRAATLDKGGDRAGSPPDEVGGMRAHDESGPRHRRAPSC